ncbi:thioesterase family protein [Nocardia farcinica]|uniref:thioesterase family protein n=1 Tax=Nocardia farcinica TaxID=37329 RepID=UPI002456B808|nr:thioesterase family protein [Nocardia farcinica]
MPARTVWRYPRYAAHARRWELLRAAGVAQDKLIASGVGPVTPENTIRYLRELRGGDELRVTCASEWSDGKTNRPRQESRRMDGTAAAPDRLL